MTTPAYDLSKCCICGMDAQFTDADPGANPVSYCPKDLPVHMQSRAAAGQMPLAPNSTTVPQLQAQARELDIEGRSSMDKQELLEAVSTEQAAGLVDAAPLSAAAEVIEHDAFAPEEAQLLTLDETPEPAVADSAPAPAIRRATRRK